MVKHRPDQIAREPRLTQLDRSRAAEVTAVLSHAFHDYPVMRYIAGDSTEAYEDKLRALVSFFVQARFLDGSPVMAVESDGVLVAAATLTAPGERTAPAEVSEVREATWAKLGDAARARYAGLCDLWGRFWLKEPHLHVNMIGVHPAHQGQGYARLLLDHVHHLSGRYADSRGVSLTTEVPANVTLYEHFGYRVTHHERVNPDLETWSLFRAERLEQDTISG